MRSHSIARECSLKAIIEAAAGYAHCVLMLHTTSCCTATCNLVFSKLSDELLQAASNGVSRSGLSGSQSTIAHKHERCSSLRQLLLNSVRQTVCHSIQSSPVV